MIKLASYLDWPTNPDSLMDPEEERSVVQCSIKNTEALEVSAPAHNPCVIPIAIINAVY